MSLYEELKWRELIKDVSDEDKAKKLLDTESVRFYCGFDPTAKSLTVGHLVQVVRMMLLQKYGHTPVVLVGGATGLIGDPRQTSERKLLSLEDSLENAEAIRIQLSRFLDPRKAIFVNNYDWVSKIDMISFLRDYGKHFNINYMLSKETVQSRLEVGISYTEFSYMLIQAIDFLHLYENEKVYIQFGGSDQWGNITTGLELIRKIHGPEHNALGLSSPLLLKSDGTKFGKSESGALYLDEELTSPFEIYQYFLNTADKDTATYLKTLTLLDKEEIELLIESVEKEPEKRIAQRRLAEEIAKLVHGKEALNDAVHASEALFTGDVKSLSERAFKGLSKTIETFNIHEEKSLVEALVLSGLATSNRDARTHIDSGAIQINGEKTTVTDKILTKADTLHNQYIVLRRGKKKYAILVFE